MKLVSRNVQIWGLAVTLMWATGCDDKKSDPDEDVTTDTVEDTDETDTAADVDEDTAVEDTVTADTVETDITTDVEEDTVLDVEEDTVIDAEEDTTEDGTGDVVEEEVITTACGNGTLETGEICDDGDTETEPCDTTDSEPCASDCSMRLDLCGNGSPDDGEQCDDGDDDSMDGCTTSCTTNDTYIGAPCTCTGGDCTALDFTAGTITGCSTLEADANANRTLGCVRSAYNATYDVSTYMAGGYCTLMALGCEGSLCFLVPTTGDVALFECPAGYVETTEERTQMGMTITAKSCLVACDSDMDCRWNEAEASGSPWEGDCGEYACLPVGDGGEYACTDPRN